MTQKFLKNEGVLLIYRLRNRHRHLIGGRNFQNDAVDPAGRLPSCPLNRVSKKTPFCTLFALFPLVVLRPLRRFVFVLEPRPSFCFCFLNVYPLFFFFFLSFLALSFPPTTFNDPWRRAKEWHDKSKEREKEGGEGEEGKRKKKRWRERGHELARERTSARASERTLSSIPCRISFPFVSVFYSQFPAWTRIGRGGGSVAALIGGTRGLDFFCKILGAAFQKKSRVRFVPPPSI